MAVSADSVAAALDVPVGACTVKVAGCVAPLLTSTLLGANVIPVAVGGVSVMAAPAAATSKLNVTLELVTPLWRRQQIV